MKVCELQIARRNEVKFIPTLHGALFKVGEVLLSIGDSVMFAFGY